MLYKIIEKYITPNEFSRPQIPISKIKGIVIHYVANPNTSAIENRNYFEKRKFGKLDYGSTHEIIDLNGDIITVIPDNEISYNCGANTYTKRGISELGYDPNYCTYSIECTHVDWTGKMTDATYNTLLERCVDLCKKYNLTEKNLYLHYEVTTIKDCHRWFVNNPNEWKLFKDKVKNKLQLKPPIPEVKPIPISVIKSENTNNTIKELINIMEKSWQQLDGENAIKELAAKGLINTPDDWMKKDLLNENVPLWLFFEMLKRIAK